MFATLFNSYVDIVNLILGAVAMLVFLNGLDDLFIDIYAHVRSLYRRLYIYPQYQPLTLQQLRDKPEQQIAIMVPAWQEAAVINNMLLNAVASQAYENYVLFVGVYANDPDTRHAAMAASALSANIETVIIPRNGPTCKADCLNCLITHIQEYERQYQIQFQAFVVHDAEDVIHPYELKLFNYLIPRKDMVQIPVLPLERRWNDFTAGHYLDEFAESHTKDLAVRESLIGHVPSAGVGCAFSRKAIEGVAAANSGNPFNTASVTEDYDFALRMALLGYTQIFVRFGIRHRVTAQDPVLKRHVSKWVTEYIATREYFPAQLKLAVKQKSRWLSGIALQGWSELGWKGSFGFKYALFRDRKAILTAPLTILAYVIALNILFLWGLQMLGLWPGDAQPYNMSGLVVFLLMANGFLLLNRMMHRCYYVYRFYGMKQAVFSIPRQVWGNVINFLAAGRAILIYAQSLISKEPISWDKTAHHFPSQDEIRPFYQRLGNLLLNRGLITADGLQQALDHQKKSGLPLGQILTEQLFVDEQSVYRALADQWNLTLIDDLTDVSMQTIPITGLLENYLPHNVILLRDNASGVTRLASNQRLSNEFLTEISSLEDMPVKAYLASPGWMARASSTMNKGS